MCSNSKPLAQQEQGPQVLALGCRITGCPSATYSATQVCSAVHGVGNRAVPMTGLENNKVWTSFTDPVISWCDTILTPQPAYSAPLPAVGPVQPGFPCYDTLFYMALGRQAKS